MAEALKLNQIEELIPPNPAALDFEKKFRDNLGLFLESMQSFETTYEDTFASLQGSSASLEDAIALMSNGSKINTTAIEEVLLGIGGSKNWTYTDSTGTTTVASGLEYSSLLEKITEMDNNISGKAPASVETEVNNAHDSTITGDTLLSRFGRVESRAANLEFKVDEALKDVGDGTSTHFSTPFTDLQSRFFASENLIEKGATQRWDSANSVYVSSGYTSIEDRFSNIEDSIGSTSSSLSGYALLSGDVTQNFSAQDLTIASNISFTGTSATLTGLQTATIHDLTVSNLLTLHQDPTNSTDAVRLSYAQNNFAKITGLNTQTFEVLTDDSQPNAADQAINKAYADGRFAPIAGDTGNPFEASTLKLNGALDMNSNLINNLTDPANAQDAVTLNYLQNNYTNSNDLGNNYAAIGGSNTENFDIQKLTVHDDVDMNSQFITNLPDPTGNGHAVNYDYLTTNYTDNNTLALTYAGINGAAGQAFDVLDPNDDTDADQDTWAISRAYADGRYAKQGGDANISFDADILTANSLLLGSRLDMQNNQIVNLPTPLSTDTADVNVNKGYVDTVKSTLLSMITSGSVPPFNVSSQDGLFLAVTSAGLNWVAPPDFDPNVNPYDWLRHPQVSFETLQFDGVIYANTTLLAGFTYFVAGDLELPDTNPDGTPCTSVLTVSGGTGTQRGATLIVQGHIKGDLTRLTLDTFNPNEPKLIVQDWADSKSDYVVKGTVNTSDLNLEGPIRYSSRLVLEDNATLNIDSNCQLIFREEVLGTGAVINQTTGTVDYFDPMLIVKDAPAALDTLKEIADQLQDTADATSIISKISQNTTDIATNTADITTNANNITTNTADIATNAIDISNLQTTVGNLNFSIGDLAYVDPTTDPDGDHVYTFTP